MFEYDTKKSLLKGTHGSLPVPSDDHASLKMAMLLKGECTETGPLQAAKEFGFSKSRYFQIRDAFSKDGVKALINKKTGPKQNYRRTPEATKLVIRARFLDPDTSPEVIASKLTQDGYTIATRSVERIIGDYGLQKKNSISPSRSHSPNGLRLNQLRKPVALNQRILAASKPTSDSCCVIKLWATWSASGF
jgi:hypothetical protein